jgi:hypothetical protein
MVAILAVHGTPPSIFVANRVSTGFSSLEFFEDKAQQKDLSATGSDFVA